MLNIYECQTTKSDILNLEILNDSLAAYTTKLHGVKIFNPNTCEIKKSITNVYLNSEVTSSAFSPNSEMFAFSCNQTIFIINIQSKEMLKSIQTDGEEVEILSFDASSTYIIAGTKKGRVLQYKYDNPTLLARICSFPHDRSSIYMDIKKNDNYVSAFAFYNNYLASSGFGGAIFVTDLRLQKNRCTITHNRNRSDALCFLDEDTIISGTSSGEIYITSLNDTKNYKSIRTPLSSIRQIILMQNPNYIMVTGKTNIISIIDINKCKIAHSKYIVLDAHITKVGILNNNYLVAALENRKIQIVELPSEAKLKSLILHNSIEKAFELIMKEPMLIGSYEDRMLQEKFDNAYLDATKALINQNKSQAVKILDPYKNVKSKQIQIRDLFSAFKNYRNFQALFYEKKYALVYAISSKFPALKQTAQYKKTEQIFKIAFSNAQRLIAQGNTEGARALLSDYTTVVSKKPIIRMILTQNREFLEFLKAIHVKDFEKINKLINTNELFKQIPNYTSLNDEIKEKLKSVEESIKSAQVESAREQLFELEEISHIKDRVKNLQDECSNVERLHKAYNDSDFKSCYKILDSHKSLSLTELGKLLEKHWSKIINQCEEYALVGNIKDIKKILGDLISLPTRLNRVGDLVRVSFHVRIKLLISKKNFKVAETIIYSYIDIFGLDNEMSQIMKKFEKISDQELAITQTEKDRPTRNSWIHSRIIIK
ncbi:MAG: hypothetical protein L3J19_09340 [Sulfurimonas sp.]|nr:hypothetical protein [Sulfurimonas sp.]